MNTDLTEIKNPRQLENDAYDCDSIANRIEKETGGKLIDYCSIKLDY